MKVVANASVPIALSRIGRLDLLSRRFPGGIWIPEAVWREGVDLGEGEPGAAEVASAPWIAVRAVRDRHLVSMLRMELDEGEAEVIALGHEQRADVVLLDEKEARRIARRLGLVVIGTVGILIWARRAGLIPSLREQLDRLQTEGKFRLSSAVYLEVLRIVGEAEP